MRCVALIAIEKSLTLDVVLNVVSLFYEIFNHNISINIHVDGYICSMQPARFQFCGSLPSDPIPISRL